MCCFLYGIVGGGHDAVCYQLQAGTLNVSPVPSPVPTPAPSNHHSTLQDISGFGKYKKF